MRSRLFGAFLIGLAAGQVFGWAGRGVSDMAHILHQMAGSPRR